MGGLIANTLVFVFPKSEKEKINNLSGLLKINDLFSETGKPYFSLTQANTIAKKMSPSFFGLPTAHDYGTIARFEYSDLQLWWGSVVTWNSKNQEIRFTVNNFQYKKNEKTIEVEIDPIDWELANSDTKKSPLKKIIFKGETSWLDKVNLILDYNLKEGNKEFTVKTDYFVSLKTYEELELNFDNSDNIILKGKEEPQTSDPLLTEKNAAIADIDNALNQNPTINNNELETANQNWRHDIQNANDLPTITAIKNRVLADIQNKRRAKQGGGGPGPGNPDSPGTPGGPGDNPDNGNDPTTPTPSKDKNDAPPPSEDEVENRFNNDPAKQQIENNQQLTEDEKQAALKLLKTLISAEILIEKGQFNQSISDELLAEKNKQSTAYKTLNERIDGVIESLKSLKQTSQNNNHPTQNKDEFSFWILPVVICLSVILIGTIVIIIKKKRERNKKIKKK
ncbi:MAG: hypothetical protein MRERV_5c028 [Mycoplasmataceae bacterium RV_VA103A]|nr:MAG: hypothetical protein MRERV_5c028 [Mycoplasmataceae bacterium RV_VA103A]